MNSQILRSMMAAALVLPSVIYSQEAAPAAQAVAKPIFDGKTLTGWKGMEGLWKVEDGAITGETTVPNQVPYNTFLVWQDGEVDDFELEFDYKIVGGNSGVQFRAYEAKGSKPEEFRISGYQADIDSGDTYTGIIYSENERGIICGRGQTTTLSSGAEPNKPKIDVTGSLGKSEDLQKGVKKEDWNHFKIVAKGNLMTNYVNGVKFCELTDNDPNGFRVSGKLAIQVHRWNTPMKIQLKNVMLKRLPLEQKKK